MNMLRRILSRFGLACALMSALLACTPSPGAQDATPSLPATSVTSGASPTPRATALVVTAPATETPAQGTPLDVPLSLQGGQSVLVETGLTITFQAVLEDSRCPTDVDCVWAGQAKVTFQMEAPGQAVAAITLTTMPDQTTPNPATYAGYVIELLDLAPYPLQLGEHPPLEQYQATLLVSAAGS
jgi:hypothetical protein